MSDKVRLPTVWFDPELDHELIEWLKALDGPRVNKSQAVRDMLLRGLRSERGELPKQPEPNPAPAIVDLDAVALAAREGARQGVRDALANITDLQPPEETVVKDDSWVDDFGAGLMIDVDEDE